MIRRVRLLNPRSELGLIAELGPQTYSYYLSHRSRRSRFCFLNPELGTSSATRTRSAILLYYSSHSESCCRFSALNSGCRKAAGL
eukprot:2673520-Pyramimonas_sp.AAC.1